MIPSVVWVSMFNFPLRVTSQESAHRIRWLIKSKVIWKGCSKSLLNLKVSWWWMSAKGLLLLTLDSLQGCVDVFSTREYRQSLSKKGRQMSFWRREESQLWVCKDLSKVVFSVDLLTKESSTTRRRRSLRGRCEERHTRENTKNHEETASFVLCCLTVGTEDV